MASIHMEDILRGAVKLGASDIHIGSERPPLLRVNGCIAPVKGAPTLSVEDEGGQREKSYEMDLAYSSHGLSRFRVKVFMQRNSVSIAIRAIPFDILNFCTLNLPAVLEKIAGEERGARNCYRHNRQR